jgi:hypothetical protein
MPSYLIINFFFHQFLKVSLYLLEETWGFCELLGEGDGCGLDLPLPLWV